MALKLNKNICYGVLWLLGALFVAYMNGFNPAKDLALAVNSRTVSGTVTEAFDDVHEDSNGNEHEDFEATYVYELPSGRKYKQTSTSDFTDIFSADEQMPRAVEIEYVPEYPSVSRIKGTGSQSFNAWLRTFAFQLVLLTILWLPGIAMIWVGYRDAVGRPLPPA